VAGYRWSVGDWACSEKFGRRIWRNLVDTAVREFNPYSRDPFARWMLEFSDELFNGHGILRQRNAKGPP